MYSNQIRFSGCSSWKGGGDNRRRTYLFWVDLAQMSRRDNLAPHSCRRLARSFSRSSPIDWVSILSDLDVERSVSGNEGNDN